MTAVRFFLRRHRRTFIGITAIALLFGSLQASGYATVAGDTAAERAAFGRETEALARQVAYLSPLPRDLGTLGGYVTWRVFGALPLMFGLWAVWFACSALRGMEEDNITEALLATSVPRGTIVSSATGAFTLMSASAVASLGGALAATSRGDIEIGALALQCLALIAVLVLAFGIGAIAAQLGGSKRSAFAIGGVALFALNLLNSLGSAVDGLGSVRQLSPLAWYSQTAPMARGGTFSTSGTIGLLALAALLLGGASALFGKRDVGSSLWHRRDHHGRTTIPVATRWFGTPVVRTLYEQRRPLLGWLVGIGAEVVLFVSLAPSMVESLQQVPQLATYLESLADGGDVEAVLVGLFLIGTVQLLLALFAITNVARWARDDASGRLEMELSAPVSRTGVVLERAGALLAATTVLAFGGLLTLYAVAAAAGMSFELGDVLLAAVLLLPFTLAFAAAGAVLTAWIPRAAVYVLVGVAVVSYFIQEVQPLYGWPESVLDLSVFHLYGNPLVTTPDAMRTAILVVFCLAGFGLARRIIQTRDVGR